MIKIRQIIILLVLVLILQIIPTYKTFADDALPLQHKKREYLVRKAMLRQLTNHISWGKKKEKIYICLYDPDKNFLIADNHIEKYNPSENHIFLYLDDHNNNTTYSCDIIYFDIMPKLGSKGISEISHNEKTLLVGDNTNFLLKGGMVSLVEVNGAIQVELNLNNIFRAGLKISPDLIEVSRRILN